MNTNFLGLTLSLLEVSYYGSSTTNCFVAYDGNESVLVNGADGTVSAQYDYGPFGELIRSTGPMAKLNPFREGTKFYDDETDMAYYGYRYYNPSTGRWLSRDPIEEAGGKNLYAFVLNDPIDFSDLNGLDTIDVTAKSWISKPITPGWVPGGNPIALLAAVAQVSALTRDRVVDDAIDGLYRFLSWRVISVKCCGSTVSSFSYSQLFTDVGLEGGFFIPPQAIVTDDRVYSVGSSVRFTWMVKARPQPLAEPVVMWPVRYRTSVYIWHRVIGSIRCVNGSPTVKLSLMNSQFPSVNVYFRINGGPSTAGGAYVQGTFSRLWYADPGDPTLVQ